MLYTIVAWQAAGPVKLVQFLLCAAKFWMLPYGDFNICETCIRSQFPVVTS